MNLPDNKYLAAGVLLLLSITFILLLGLFGYSMMWLGDQLFGTTGAIVALILVILGFTYTYTVLVVTGYIE